MIIIQAASCVEYVSHTVCALLVIIRKFPCVKPVKKDEFSFLCTVCNKVISCKHQGVKDVKRHIEGLNHSKVAKGADRQCTLAFRQSSDPISGKVL